MIGAYVSWIEINLVANDKFVAVLLKYLRMELLRESACECIHEVLSKGMDPVAKLKLVESFFTVLEAGGFLAPAQVIINHFMPGNMVLASRASGYLFGPPNP